MFGDARIDERDGTVPTHALEFVRRELSSREQEPFESRDSIGGTSAVVSPDGAVVHQTNDPDISYMSQSQ